MFPSDQYTWGQPKGWDPDAKEISTEVVKLVRGARGEKKKPDNCKWELSSMRMTGT